MKFATGFDGDEKISGVLRVHANQWDRGKFQCQVSEDIVTERSEAT